MATTATLHCNSNGFIARRRSQRSKSITVRARIRSPTNPRLDRMSTSGENRIAWAASVCDTIEQLIEKHLDPLELPACSDPAVQLAGNFAPVVEQPPTQCTRVQGHIPPCLYGGVYVRNGANPLHPPKGGYHYFDGHGMLHAVKLGSRAGELPTYACRYTRTNRYNQEHRAGRPLFPNALGTYGTAGMARMALLFVRGGLGVVDLGRGEGTANAGLAFHNGRLLAMSESDMPYAVHVAGDGDLVTLGRCSFGGRLRGPMTAHPKVDSRTGDMYTYGYNVLRKPYLSYFNVSAAGAMSRQIVLDGITEPVLVHDFAVTENYAIIPENQITFSIRNMLDGGSAVVLKDSKVPKFWVLPKHVKDYKDGKTSVRSFEVPDFTAFHFINSWEEGDTIVMIGSRQEPLSAVFDCPENLMNMVHEVRLDLSTGEVRRSRVSPAVLDVGQLNHRFISRKSRYAYLSISGPWPRFAGIAKVDLQSTSRRSATCLPTVDDADLDRDPAISAWRKFGNGVYGSEPFFVSATTSFEPDDEDNGYVLCYIHNEITNVSELLIMDARSPNLETVAAIELPFRVPYGFHGLFITKDQLSRQNQSPL